MDFSDISTRCAFALGLLGSVLGIMATWRQMAADRVRLRVDALIALQDGETRLAVRVVNLSAFAVTIQTIGFAGRRGHRFHFHADALGGETLPHRLEARTELTVLVPSDATDNPDFQAVRRPEARTACGECRAGPASGVEAYRKLRAAEQAARPAEDRIAN